MKKKITYENQLFIVKPELFLLVKVEHKIALQCV